MDVLGGLCAVIKPHQGGTGQARGQGLAEQGLTGAMGSTISKGTGPAGRPLSSLEWSGWGGCLGEGPGGPEVASSICWKWKPAAHSEIWELSRP